MPATTTKPKAPTISELQWARMELTAKAGRAIADRASARGGLTPMESRQLIVMGIEQDARREEWASQLRSEGKRVDLLDYPDRSLRTGITVNNVASDRPSISIYGVIGDQYGGIAADDLRRAFEAVHPAAPVDLHVHSDGGDFSEGVAMRSLVASRLGSTYGFVDGLAASAATFPLMACTTITMSVGSRMMIHQASASLKNGQMDDFENAAKTLKETNDAIAAIYMPRWNGSKATLIAALEAETWMTPEQAIAYGLADHVGSELALAARVSDRRNYKNIPAPLTIAARLEDCPNRLACGLMMHRVAIVR